MEIGSIEMKRVLRVNVEHHRDVTGIHDMGLGVEIIGAEKEPVFWSHWVTTLETSQKKRALIVCPVFMTCHRQKGTEGPDLEVRLQQQIEFFTGQVPVEYFLEVFTTPVVWKADDSGWKDENGDPIEMERVDVHVYAFAYPSHAKRVLLSKPAFFLLLLAHQVERGGVESVDLDWWPGDLDFDWANLPLKQVASAT